MSFSAATSWLVVQCQSHFKKEKMGKMEKVSHDEANIFVQEAKSYALPVQTSAREF